MTEDIRNLDLAAHDTSPDAMVVGTFTKKILPSWLGPSLICTKDDVLPGYEPVALKHLLPPIAQEAIRHTRPENLSTGKPLEEFIERAVVDFTCFTMSDDIDIFTLDGMISVLLQGCAVGVTQSNIGIIGDQSKNKAVTGPETVPSNIAMIDKQHGYGDSKPAEGNKHPPRGSTEHHEASLPHYQLYLRDSPLIPTTIRQSLLELDTALTSYKKTLAQEGLAFNNVDLQDGTTTRQPVLWKLFPVSVRFNEKRSWWQTSAFQYQLGA
ncbi:hypothetical protein PLEOSDRAFT_1108571 [Pleurotus ostreatus PC15]|uniref:Uncharacterized protein n=1 Tax=Pleurotus ostreatus (strain PC15) TaxID=1137138 RepID=A0A067NKJ6_PLEO1|nr:hypothetical protein PLEOSDRAFT_1108571 [Pleurotus ostreatus PC15]